ncbi:Hypothetical predicted protein [Pelobates cultripes]|uniref:Uncharacterized protein n=1 Tax=Pelobates cultripes TaxID=61616 RepID=A0AAD1W5E1_PELCU|nr:Hypothetical predicted protein [Pelobates cultripes]
MPFLYPQTGRKTRRISVTYLEYRTARPAPDLLALTAALSSPFLISGETPHRELSNMGLSSQKPPPGANRDSLDISTMLQRPTPSKMAISPDSENYLEEPEETSEKVTEPQQTHYPTAERRENLNPATKKYVADLLQEMRQMHSADLDLIKTEIQAVTTCTQA